MRKSLVFSLLFFLLGLALFFQAQKIKPLWEEPMGPKAYPQATAILIIISSGINVGKDLINIRKKEEVKTVDENKASVNKGTITNFLPRIFIGMLCFLYVIGLTFLGFYTSTIFFSVASMSLISYYTNRELFRKELITRILPVSIGIVLVLFLGMSYMHIYLPQGGILW